ncbi:hypothetical protein [Wenjunlia tyrosinilytica]|nr:hypothetical protein [Wenjunlia tyrosinilytica]
MAADRFTQIRNALFRDPRLSFKAKGVFGLISTHRDGYGITPDTIAAASTDGVSAVKTALRELERYGYLTRERERRPDGTLGTSTYFITDQPETDPETLPEPQNPRSEPEGDYPPVDKPPVDNRLHKKNNNPKNTNEQNTSAPAARSAPDGRRPPAVPSARARSGCAAPEPPHPPPRTTTRPRSVRWVVTALPPQLRRTLPDRLPASLTDAVTAALEQGRTPDQLAARIERRWNHHGHAARFHAGQITRPVGVAVALVRPGECPDPRCEDGHNIDTGAACPRCEERRADRRRATDAPSTAAAVPRQRNSAPAALTVARYPECPGNYGLCGRPMPVDSTLCPECATQQAREAV